MDIDDMKKFSEEWVKVIKKGETPPEIPLPVQHPLWLVFEGMKVLLERKESLDTDGLMQQLTDQMQLLISSVPQSLDSSPVQKDLWKDRILYLLVALTASLGTVLVLSWGMGQIPLTGKEMRLARHLVEQGLLESMALCKEPFEITPQGLCRPVSKVKDGQLILPAWEPIR